MAAFATTIDPLPFALHHLELAECRLRDAKPGTWGRCAEEWRARYFEVFRLMHPGRVYRDGRSVVTRHEDRVEVAIIPADQRRAS